MRSHSTRPNLTAAATTPNTESGLLASQVGWMSP